MSQVLIQDLNIRFGGNEVIQKLNLEVKSGEFLVLLGPSGCGKSTLLHSIAGLNPISGGRILIGGQDMSTAPPSERGLGMVFQSYALYPHMSVRDNLGFPLRMAGLPKDEKDRRIAKAAAMLQLEPLLERRPAQLSGGQRQRVAIGRALVREADLLLLDEPLSNLDAKLRTELRRELKQLHARLSNTMIYVTHDQVEAMTLATRIVVMYQGQILQIGSPAEVYERPSSLRVASFVGSPSINHLPGELRAGQFCAGPLQLAGPSVDAGAISLAVRPEDVLIGPDQPFAGVVDLVEPLGNQHLLWMSAGERTVCAVLPGQANLAAGDAVRFGFDAQRLHWFDAAGHRLG
ncbi:ABC transporter ATP-binding protein [Paucibacter sp. Y2R2-4]|uniref:ABC transporter ATP-binding protein n=1 Tax=Paucibacter sp. Y2R2-4 TaxID=2893553 RepID=UPI0021E4E516|nr:ABC transporter ATP-binding protein [Paucibacter sp. Y2R2-4]MCV2348685.1 ABC transporter ATP-binding protein [Paucibacter sp. Y2R2-4]